MIGDSDQTVIIRRIVELNFLNRFKLRTLYSGETFALQLDDIEIRGQVNKNYNHNQKRTILMFRPDTTAKLFA